MSIQVKLVLGVLLVSVHCWLIKAHLQGPTSRIESFSSQPYQASTTAWQTEAQIAKLGS